MRRLSLVLLALFVGAPPAMAQSREWSPWREYSNGYPGYYGSARRPSNAQQRNRRQADDDDDDDNGSVFGGQLPYRKSTVQYPKVLEGGPRPYISAQAPQTVPFRFSYPQNSIVVETSGRALYYVLGNGSAYRYPISVGRDGFTWKGNEKISRVAEWPDWHPPAEMRERDPKLPEVMTGGLRNPLGAKALYLGNSLYRIHGTNDAKSIGYAASSGCFRMMNYHVLHLASLAGVGTSVAVVERLGKGSLSQAPATLPTSPKNKRVAG